jgi:hypothetical protein
VWWWCLGGVWCEGVLWVRCRHTGPTQDFQQPCRFNISLGQDDAFDQQLLLQPLRHKRTHLTLQRHNTIVDIHH